MSEDKETYVVLNNKQYIEIDFMNTQPHRLHYWKYLVSHEQSNRFDIIHNYGDSYIESANRGYYIDIRKIGILKQDYELINKIKQMVNSEKTIVTKEGKISRHWKLFGQSNIYNNSIDCFYSFFELSQEQQQLLITEWQIANL